MKKASKLVSLLMAAAMLFALTACGGGTQSTPAPSASSAAATGGTLTIVNGGVLKNVSGFPIAGGFVEQFCSAPAIETLARYNEKGEVIPWLAKEINVDKQNLKIVVKLQEGVKFSDGADFNAKTVVDVWDIYKANGYASKFSNVKSYSATGANEVTVILTQWAADTLSRVFIEAGWMIQPELFKQYGMEGMYTKIVGTGPFIAKSVKVGEGIEYAKNPNYRIKGQPILDGIKIITAKDINTAANILKSGEAQVMLNIVDPKVYTELISGGFQRFGLDTCITPTLQGIFFASGSKTDPMGNVLVRQAFCHAIDTKAIIKAFTYGTGTYTNQLAVPGTQEYNDKVAGYPYDVNKAKELLKKAGYSDTNKPTVTLTYQLQFKDIYVAIQGYLQAAGFNVKLDEVDAAVYGDRIIVGKPTPYTSTAQWIAPPNATGWTRYFTATPTTMVGPAMDLKGAGIIDLYSKYMYGTDPARQKEALMELQKKNVDELCLYFPLYITQNLYAGTAKVKDHGIATTAISLWTPETVRITK